jgi:heat shock protein HtpX
MNVFKTTLLLGLLTLLLLFMGQALGGSTGLTVALVVAGVMNFVGYFYSDKIALASYGAEPLSPDSQPDIYWRVYKIVERLAGRMGIPMPRLYLVPSDSPNAFATGRNPQHAAVAVTQGVLALLNDEELEGVLAHELGHVKNRDILISSVAAMIAGAITYLAHMARWAMIFGGYGRSSSDDDSEGGGGLGALLMLILAPIAALLIQLWVSRTREYEADQTGAALTGNPQGLARALEKLEGWSKRIPLDAAPATAHLCIVKPFSGAGMMEIFSTHPPMEKRIARLLGRA